MRRIGGMGGTSLSLGPGLALPGTFGSLLGLRAIAKKSEVVVVHGRNETTKDLGTGDASHSSSHDGVQMCDAYLHNM